MRCIQFVAAALITSSLAAQTNVQRPRVLGVAHVAIRVSDMEKTRAFYKEFLGYEEPFSLKDANGNIATAFVKVNDSQFVELFPGDAKSQGQLDHFSLSTDNLTGMREYLSSQGVPILEDAHIGRIGNAFLTVKDPDGHPIEIVQYSQNSLTARSQGRFMPAGRVSSHITHVGILVSSVGPAMRFYRDILGFREFSRGGGQGGQPGWVDLRAPNGNDYIELLPFAGVPSPADMRARNHFCLVSPDVRKTVASLQGRVTSGLLTSPITVQTGDNLPPRANVFDPDGARVEVMESVSTAASATATSYP